LTDVQSLDISAINDYLFIGAGPQWATVEAVRRLGIKLIINMVPQRRVHHTVRATGVKRLWLPTIDSFLTPIPMRYLERGVRTALPIIGEGGKVLVYCEAGRHRSVAMAASILVGRGYSSGQAMALIAGMRPVADPYIWYIRRRIEQFEAHWQRIIQRQS
jgi:protein tyrosine phosphatase (PTP) superfamily phosphohydrolase (DUF442 family)